MKIALIGYGKMGKMIEQIALSRGHEIVSIIDIDNQEEFESEAFASADVAIEFTAPHTAYANYLKAWAKGVKVVSGSTGWLKDHGDDVKRACKWRSRIFPISVCPHLCGNWICRSSISISGPETE